MDSKINEKIDAKIVEGLSDLSLLNLESIDREDAVLNLDRMYRMRLEADRVQADIDVRNRELELKEAQLAEEKRKNDLQHMMAKKTLIKDAAIGGIGIVLPLWAYNIWNKRGFEFEKTGTIVSSTFRNLLGKVKIFK